MKKLKYFYTFPIVLISQISVYIYFVEFKHLKHRVFYDIRSDKYTGPIFVSTISFSFNPLITHTIQVLYVLSIKIKL